MPTTAQNGGILNYNTLNAFTAVGCTKVQASEELRSVQCTEASIEGLIKLVTTTPIRLLSCVSPPSACQHEKALLWVKPISIIEIKSVGTEEGFWGEQNVIRVKFAGRKIKRQVFCGKDNII
jgi:hypothetical protein